MDFFSGDAPNFNQRTAYLEALFGPRGGIPGSDNDLSALARGLKGSPRKPKLYLACGDQDSLLPLNLQLKQELEADGFLHREVYPEVPPRVEYTLTAMGESFLPVLNHMLLWSETHLCPPDYVNPYQDGGRGPLPGTEA